MKGIHFPLFLCAAMIFFLSVPLYGQGLNPLSEKIKRKDDTTQTDSYPKQAEISKPDQKSPSASPVISDITRKTEKNATNKAKDGKTDKPPICRSLIWKFFANHWNDIFLTLFTLAVAFFTYRLYRVTAGLWDVAKKQLEIIKDTAESAKIQAEVMRQEFTLKQRPMLHIRDVVIENFPMALGMVGKYPKGKVSIVNIGGIATNMAIIGYGFEVMPWEELPENPRRAKIPKDLLDPRHRLEPGEEFIFDFTDRRKEMGRECDSIRRGMKDYTAYVIGYITHVDGNNVSRTTTFFRKYGWPKGRIGGKKEERRFFPVEGYEYEE